MSHEVKLSSDLTGKCIEALRESNNNELADELQFGLDGKDLFGGHRCRICGYIVDGDRSHKCWNQREDMTLIENFRMIWSHSVDSEYYDIGEFVFNVATEFVTQFTLFDKRVKVIALEESTFQVCTYDFEVIKGYDDPYFIARVLVNFVTSQIEKSLISLSKDDGTVFVSIYEFPRRRKQMRPDSPFEVWSMKMSIVTDSFMQDSIFESDEISSIFE